jgi:hypothetical protein
MTVNAKVKSFFQPQGLDFHRFISGPDDFSPAWALKGIFL